MSNMRHAGRIVAITGGSSGIGQAIVLRLVSEGAKVAVIDTFLQPMRTGQTMLIDGEEGHL